MPGLRRILARLAPVVLLVLAAPAWAQDYTDTEVSGQYISPPSTKTTHSLGDDVNVGVTIAFDFPFFGNVTRQIYVHSNGYLQVGPPSVPSGSAYNFANNVLPVPGTDARENSMVLPLWDDLNPNNGGTISSWTQGTSGSRIFVADWTGINRYSGTGSYTFQAQLHENGDIILAYGPNGGTWTNLSCSIGIQASRQNGDTRFVSPNNTILSAHPGTDYKFVPDVTTFDGTVLVDEIVSDATGIGNTQLEDTPLGNVRINLTAGGVLVGSTTTDANGDYSLRGVALPSANSGELKVVAESLAGPVSTAPLAGPSTTTIADNLDFGEDHELGTYTLDDTTDADGSARAPIAIAKTLGTMHAWYLAETGIELPAITTLYDTADTSTSRYTAADPVAPSPASIRIGSTASVNPDAHDTAMVARMYARHILAAINGSVSPGAYDARIDAASSIDNAFAEGFSLYLYARIFDTSETFDGLDATTTTAFDLDDPSTLVTARGPTVSGWAAAALWDLIDDDLDENHDRVDGTVGTANERPYDLIDQLTVLPTPTNFRDAWDAAGHDTGALTRNFIHHGLFPDDSYEPNDDSTEAADLGPVGVLVEDLVLSQQNADWFQITLESSVDALFVDVQYNRFAVNAVITLELRDAGGGLVAAGAPDGLDGPYRVQTGALTAGNYMIHVRHDGGDRIPAYTMQAFSRLTAGLPPAPDWTAGQPLNFDLDVIGGIPPYTILVNPDLPLPVGLVLDAPNQRVHGSVSALGPSPISVRITDSGSPVNSASVSRTLTINPVLAFSVGEYLGVPVGRPTEVGLGRTGGTEPVTITDQTGVVPQGLQLSTPDFVFTGTAASEGSSALDIQATDVAGSTDTASTIMVACVSLPTKNSPVDLAAGDAASGYYIDAVRGTLATLKTKTAKKREKRPLDLVVIGPDGLPVAGGKVKTGVGKAIGSKIPLLQTGRYYFILPSATGGETQLTGTAKLALPKGAKGAEVDFGVGDDLDIPFGALTGAKLTFKAKAKDGLLLRVAFLVKPDGTFIPGTSLETYTEKGSALIVGHPLDQSGTWTLKVSAKPGNTGSFKWSNKVKQPKRVAFVAD